VAVLGVILPFFSGLALMFLFGRTTLEALFIGAAMVATSVGITARVLKDLGVMESIEGRVIIGAAVIDDVLGLIVLAMISGIAQGGTLNLADIAVVAALAVAFVLVVIYISALLPKVRTSSPVMSVLKKRKPRNLPAHFNGGPFDGLTMLVVPRLPAGTISSYNEVDTLIAQTRSGASHVYHATNATAPWEFYHKGLMTGPIPENAKHTIQVLR
jgi:hypothetical protein